MNDSVAALDAVTTVTRNVGDWGNYWGLRLDFTHVLHWRILPGLAAGLVGFAAVLLLTTSNSTPDGPGLSKVHLVGGSSLAGASLSKADLSDAVLANVSLAGANLSSADLSGADLSGADLSSANLKDATMTGATLKDAMWAHTVCPDGTNSDAVGGSCLAHLVPPPPDAGP